MKIRQELAARIKNESGATAILVAIVIVVLISIAALAVDIGYVMTTKNELQNIADGAALAATRQLGAIYAGMPSEQHETYVCDSADIETIKGAALDVALKNKAGGENITFSDGDVIIGDWDGNNFAEKNAQPDAVRVTARRDGAANGPITTFFAKIFGVNTVDVWADATAALTGQSTTGPGELELPIGISEWRFVNDYCDEPIRFYPTGDMYGCAGWNTFVEDPPNASTLRDILDGLVPDPPAYESPETIAGDTQFEFIGGNVASVFPEMEALFMAKSEPTSDLLYISPQGEPLQLVESNYPDAQPIFDKNGNHKHKRVWETLIVVYESDDCSNPGGAITIVGFATVKMTAVNGSAVQPSYAKHTIFGEIVCEKFSDGYGGGGEYGTKGTMPNLVE